MPIIQMRACDYRQVARERLSGNWGVAVLTSFVASLLGSATTNGYSSYFNLGFDSGLKSSDFDISGSYNDFSLRDLAEFLQSHPSLAAIITIWFAVSAICALASFILGGATKAGLCEFNKGLYDGNPDFNDLFKHYSIFGKAFLTNLLVGIFTTLWTMLFIIPGIIASFSYSMTFYILADHPEMDVMDAIQLSKEMMRGHKWQLFCLQLSFIGWNILAAFSLGIGFLFLAPYKEQSSYAFYRNISGTAPIEFGEQSYEGQL